MNFWPFVWGNSNKSHASLTGKLSFLKKLITLTQKYEMQIMLAMIPMAIVFKVFI